MPTALVISRYFPPLGSTGGSIRLIKFLKYTSLRGWKFIICTQDLERTVVEEEWLSASLLPDIPADAQIERVPAPFGKGAQNKNRLFVWKLIRKAARKVLGDSSLAWGARVFLRALSKRRQWAVDLIYSASPPFTGALIGALLSIFLRKPYALDLKDDWVGSPGFAKKSLFRQKAETWMEKAVIATAAAVVTVTPESFELYAKRYPRQAKKGRIFCVPNGCDLEEYDILKDKQRKIEDKKFTILSAAWGFRKDYRDLSPFLKSLALFIKRNSSAKQNISVLLPGSRLSGEYKREISELDLGDVVRGMDAVGRRELVEMMWKADLFFLIQPIGNTTAISGTLYEYWAVGKAPIMLISEKGASSLLVERNRLGRHFHFSQTEECAQYIERVYRKHQSNTPEWISRAGVERFDRRKLAEQMESIWKRALKHHPAFTSSRSLAP